MKTPADPTLSRTELQPEQPIVVEGWTWGLDEEHSTKAAKNATAPSQLIRMADDILDGLINLDSYSCYSDISSLLIRNPNLPLQKARLLRKSTNDPYCLLDLVSRLDATAELLDECADEACQYVVNNIVHHENVRPETVAKITENSDLDVVSVALTSSRLPEETLESFATSKVPDFRETVAYRSKNPKTLANLAFDPVPCVRAAAVGRDILDVAVLEKVATTDNNIEVVIEATKRLTNPDVLRAVYDQLGKWHTNAKAQELKDALVANPHTSELVRVVIQI